MMRFCVVVEATTLPLLNPLCTKKVIWRMPCKTAVLSQWASSSSAQFKEPLGGLQAPPRAAALTWSWSECLPQEGKEDLWGNVKQQLLENMVLERCQPSPHRLIPKHILKVTQTTLILLAT